MVYGYIRVSTDKQTVDNQRYEIEQFCLKNNILIDHWIEETISGTQSPNKRLLGTLLERVRPGDLIVCSELSRLGRDLYMIMTILNHLTQHGVKILTIKGNYRLDSTIQAKILAFAFGLAAEIERDLISQRTKEALARRQSEGIILGRPHGSKSARHKLTGYETEIQNLLEEKISCNAIGNILGVDRKTVVAFIKAQNL
ncbi:MAG: master DNA invertase Mpi family serine-type recombinase [Treponema sp.]|nr:master DNA invertase Mpi family serine-type recombinase [Treponema sp.]